MGEAQIKKHCDLLHEVKIEVTIDTLGGVEVSKIVKTWTDTVFKMKTRTAGDTLVQLEVKALINRSGDTLA